MDKLNDREKQFLKEFHELLEKFNIEIEAVQFSNYLGGGCCGIDIYGVAEPINDNIKYSENVIDLFLKSRIIDTSSIKELLDD